MPRYMPSVVNAKIVECGAVDDHMVMKEYLLIDL